MMRLHFYTAICLLLVPSAFCSLEEELSNVWKNLQSSICYQLIRPEYLDNYVKNFDTYWDFDYTTRAMNDIYEKYYMYDSYEQRDCPEKSYIDYHYNYWDFNDMACNIDELQRIGWRFQSDLVKFHELRNDKHWDTCSAFKMFMSAWHLHPVFGKLNCYDKDEAHYRTYALYQYVYNSGVYWAGSRATDWLQNPNPTLKMTDEMECQTVYSKSVIANLRIEIEDLCRTSAYQPVLCEVKGAMEIAAKVDNLLEYIKSPAPVTGHYLDALHIATDAEMRKMNILYPNWRERTVNRVEYYQFHSTYESTSWIHTKVKELSMFILSNMDSVYNNNTDKGPQLHYILDLLPADYHCASPAEFGSLCWTIDVFIGMIKTLKQNANVMDANKKILVNTAIDYKAFLEHTQTERLLKLSETSQSNLMAIAKELRDDIVHSLDQSIQQSAAESTNQITGAVQSGFDTLKKHLQQEASFDKEIAKADIAFINAEITKYTNSSNELKEKVSKLIGNILYHAFVAATGDNAEAAVKLAAQLLSMFNPFKWLTGGTSAVDVMDASAEYFQSVATLLKTDTLKNAWQKLRYYSYKFARALAGNQAYLENIGKLVKSMSADTPPWDFERSKKLFIKGYNDYSPGVNIGDLTEVNTYWELLIDEACDLIDSTSGTVSGGAKIALGSDCFDAKGEVQKFMALNEEIFDFQFDMMDALTECVRASNNYASASAVTTGLITVQKAVSANRNSDVLTELQMLAAYSSMLYRLTVIAAKENYCNVLEYREGSRPELCKIHDWNLASLLSRTQASYHSTQDFKTVPTRPRPVVSSDKAFIDLKDLYAGKVVRFQIPNSDWLVDRGWIASDDRDKPIYVQRFEVYLPVSSTSEKQVSVKAEATVGNQLRRDSDGRGTEYVISPRRSLTFAYKEGPGTCRNEKIPNPYNINCRTMPDLCQVSTDVTDAAHTVSVFPSIYAMWHIQLSGYETANPRVPVTNIDLMIGLQTATPLSSRRRRSLADTESNHRLRRSFGTQRCCEKNMFLNETAKCETCPPNSEAKYNALLCECKPCENGGQLLQGSDTCSCVCGTEYNGPLCESRKCKDGEEFTCKIFKCIPMVKYCDKTPDCDDLSDEPEGCKWNSPKDCESEFCCHLTYSQSSDNFCRLLGINECVPNSWVCNGNYDCSTKKDEATCVEGGQQPKDISCADGWIYYAGACWYAANFGSESKTRKEAADHCQGAGGTLAEFRTEEEHWFSYTLFIPTVTGKTVSAWDYDYIQRLGVSDKNVQYGVSTYENDIWWIGKFDPTLSKLSYGSTSNETDDTEKSYGSTSNETDGTEKCFGIGKWDWKYHEQDCGRKADGVICTYIPSEHTSDTSQGPGVVPDNQGSLGNGTVAEIMEGLQDLNKKMGENMGEIGESMTAIQGALSKQFDGVNDNLQDMDKKVDQNMGEMDGSLTAMQEALLKEFKGMDKKMDENNGEMGEGLKGIEEALEGVNDNLQGMDEKVDQNMGEMGGSLTAMQEALLKEFRVMDKKMDEALEGVNDNLHQLIEELEQRNGEAHQQDENAPSQNQDTPGGTESNGGDTGIGGIHGSSWNNHFPSWMNDTNFPFGKR